jgi:hypothetical protein
MTRDPLAAFVRYRWLAWAALIAALVAAWLTQGQVNW